MESESQKKKKEELNQSEISCKNNSFILLKDYEENLTRI